MQKILRVLSITLGLLLIIGIILGFFQNNELSSNTDSFMLLGIGVLFIIRVKPIFRVIAIVLYFILSFMIEQYNIDSENSSYFKEHSSEIIKQVESKYGEGNYTGAMFFIDKYSILNNNKLKEIKQKIEKIEKARKEKEDAEKVILKEKEDKAHAIAEAKNVLNKAYSQGGLPSEWPLTRQCVAVSMQDTSGIHIIDSTQAINRNYIANVSVNYDKALVKTLWDKKSYKGSFVETKSMEGFTPADDDIFTRAYVNFFGTTQINLLITAEQEMKSDFTIQTIGVHYVQLWRTEEAVKYVFKCEQ